jgi:endonuclease/exonuclease/phosphatase family metal-dependent hydrolase
LGRFPLRESIVEKFEQPEGLRFLLRDKKDGLASKGILLTRFDLGKGRTLDVYNTHMEAGGDEPSNEVRRRQARHLIRMVRQHSPPEHAVILAGDLNMRAPARKKQSLGPKYPRNLEGLSRPQIYEAIVRELGLVNAAAISGESPASLIDHILYRSGTSVPLEPVSWARDTRLFRSKAGEAWSDHDPIIATFKVRD